MLIEIILAFVIAMGITYFMFELIIKIKNKNDDLLVKTLVSTDQAIITNQLMNFALDEKKDFNCNNVKVNDKVVTYNDKVITIISEYANVGTVTCNNKNNMVNINIPISVKQLKDNFNVSVNYRYGEADNIAPTCSLSVNSDGEIKATYSDDEGGSGISYYGWNSSYNDSVSNSEKINNAGTYTFYVKDYAENTNNCSITVVNTDVNESCPNKGTPPGCYKVKNATVKSGICYCYCNTYDFDEPTLCNTYDNVTNCNKCPYNTSDFVAEYECTSGTLSGQYCIIYENSNKEYVCPSGYSKKINNNYCYKVN